jgi:hypothetical protein
VVIVGFTVTAIPLVTVPTPLLMLPVPLLNTAVSVVEAPAVIDGVPTVKLLIDGGNGAGVTVTVNLDVAGVPVPETVRV